MDPTEPRNYQALAAVLATRMAAENDVVDTSIRTGRAWGASLVAEGSRQPANDDDQAVDRLMGILADLGFSPQRGDSAARNQIALNHCPFLDLVPRHQSVICPIHLGLMQGAMTAMGASTTIESLEPFVEPDLCLAHVGKADAAP